jgi:transposase
MPYQIAGIDVHKKMLAVVVADVEVEGDYHFERLKVGTSPAQLRALADWLVEREVEEVVMESTAQYWRPVWEALEQYWRPVRRTRAGASPVSGTLHLAQAQSNRGAGGRKRDFPDAERLVKRLVAQELTLSFVPDAEQRLWRTVMRRKYQITRNRVQLHNRLESLLEEAHIKLPASSRICWAPAHDVCCRPWPTAKRIPRRWRRWRTTVYARRRLNYPTPSRRARPSTPCIAGC